MKKVSKQTQRMEATHDKPAMTMGLDMGDRFSHYCLLNEEGDVAEEGRMQSTEAAFRRHFASQPRMRDKKRAIVAVARKLAVILHSMWRSGRRFQPFPQTAMAVA